MKNLYTHKTTFIMFFILLNLYSLTNAKDHRPKTVTIHVDASLLDKSQSPLVTVITARGCPKAYWGLTEVCQIYKHDLSSKTKQFEDGIKFAIPGFTHHRRVRFCFKRKECASNGGNSGNTGMYQSIEHYPNYHVQISTYRIPGNKLTFYKGVWQGCDENDQNCKNL